MTVPKVSWPPWWLLLMAACAVAGPSCLLWGCATQAAVETDVQFEQIAETLAKIEAKVVGIEEINNELALLRTGHVTTHGEGPTTWILALGCVALPVVMLMVPSPAQRMWKKVVCWKARNGKVPAPS